MRPFKESAGVSVEDIAKRLIDYGFHAPTMSFPVAGTLMIEPTESESKAELDRFCDAMIAIRAEIAEIEDRAHGPQQQSAAERAAYRARSGAGRLDAALYARAGCFPLESLQRDKYWSPVNRIDNVYGDRNLICSCQTSDFAQEAAE